MVFNSLHTHCVRESQQTHPISWSCDCKWENCFHFTQILHWNSRFLAGRWKKCIRLLAGKLCAKLLSVAWVYRCSLWNLDYWFSVLLLLEPKCDNFQSWTLSTERSCARSCDPRKKNHWSAFASVWVYLLDLTHSISVYISLKIHGSYETEHSKQRTSNACMCV